MGCDCVADGGWGDEEVVKGDCSALEEGDGLCIGIVVAIFLK